jgi:hypothetical protein
MNPLFDKYFHHELNDAEEQELDALLKSSQDAAWEFGHAAEEDYVRFGLPEPRLPGKGKGVGFMANAGVWTLLLILLTLFLLFRMRDCGKVPVPAIPEPVPTPTKAVHVKKAAPRPRTPTPTPVIVVQPAADPTQEAMIKQVGTNLRVVVNRPEAGLVAVNVYDSKGVRVRHLYEGMLQPGRWAFQWDARDADGQQVVPGKYRITVTSEGSTQSKELDIH